MKKLFLMLIFMGITSIAFSDLTMTYVFEDHESGEKQTSVIYLSKDKVRSENKVEGMAFASIGRMDKDVLWMIRPDKKIYAEMTMAEMRRMEEQAMEYEASARSMMEEQLKHMSEEEKAQYREFMGFDGEDDTPLKYVKKGQDRVGKWTCTIYEGMRHGEKIEEICTVPLSTLGVVKKDFEALAKMSKNDDGFLKDWKEAEKMGFPVRTIEFEDGEAITTNLILSFEKKTVPAAMFEIPAGYKKVSMMGLYGE
ncbi:uncharacterized protein DUF4412 [Desulfobotulus alkaliphilus]|uniref:Uncharacterized protein DUF4412 n=1 Tax=Desulfobotulus alkaliphilus TaxID=622671 RepID=A0A562S7Z3_9BACT|nr:DUF4412 domain-containing protein [Desulfobotulus alkaliphilus]TWI77482.1 uncharacterized protein DUF4412 [Desulfobotulus alkaliphilus]